MNIIFLTLARIDDIQERGIYQDLMREFAHKGHTLYIMTPCERRHGLETSLEEKRGIKVLNVKTLNIQKTNVVEKGIGTLLIEKQYETAIKKFWGDVKFDLIIYSTPPITLPNVITYLKRKNPQASSYLLLKDIFPQNAVDLGMMSKRGLKGLLYKFFRNKEKRLYALSDYIGCMSPANVEYVLKHNAELSSERVEVAPNSIDLRQEFKLPDTERDIIRIRFGLPVDKPVFIYGGNLGKPQGIPYLIDCLEAVSYREDCFFLVVGTGTEYDKLDSWLRSKGPGLNVLLMKGLPKTEYDKIVRACDVGLIFLDHRFTIPNFPSRLLSYLENKMPVICATDSNTDMGRIAEKNGFGMWCESLLPESFITLIDRMLEMDRKKMGEKGYEYLKRNYTVQNTYMAIMRHYEDS